MKKTLLLSVVASTMIMAGGDIAPVEPVVEAPVVKETTSGWDFSGEAALYFQTMDQSQNAGVVGPLITGTPDLFAQESSAANVGLRVSAVNTNMFAGIGAGFELVGLGTLGLENDIVSSVMQTGDGSLNSGAITQAYLTYGIGNTSLKVGRQTLPKALSPFAFSETWNVFQNTFGAALLVNSDLPDTTLVGAYVADANSHVNLSAFDELNQKGIYMLTAQNKSISGLALTGTYYYAPEMFITEDAHILWGDALFSISDYAIGLQGGTILTGEPTGITDTVAFGAKAGATFGMFNVGAAYTSVDEGTVGIANLAGGTTFSETPLYTQMLANVNHIARDNDTFVVNAGIDILGGNLGVVYGYTTDNQTANSDYTEIDVAFKTNITENTSLLAAYIYADDETATDVNNIIRVWGRYNF